MAFCANCGSALTQGSGFCGSCGKPVVASSQPLISSPTSVSGGAAVAAAPAPGTVAAASGLTSNTAAALSYLIGFITGIIFLVLEPYKHDRFVRFHAMQSVMFSVAFIVFNIAWSIVWGILLSVSGYLVFIDLPLRLLISLGAFGLWLFCMYQAYSHREFRIPIIGAFAAKQTHF